ncbi:MAG: diaminopimelate decarboxylase [Candidatus Eremiobacteraeota bacterium]|nr:diaminopimelate decarboxylase [Candidatus Eremiobacteraeota bacterium]
MISANSAATLGGVRAVALAEKFGTPLLVIDTDAVDAAVAQFETLAERYGLEVAYAGKAFLNVAFAKRLANTRLSLDVCSLGELVTAERAGIPAPRIVFHGCGKTGEELSAVVDGRAARIVVDNREELERLAARANPAKPVSIILRINPGIEAHTHAYVRTGGEESKFGFPLGEVEAAVVFSLAQAGLVLNGIHAHIGSNIFEAAPYEAAAVVALGIYARALELGAPLASLICGGGFGVDPYPGGERVALDELIAGLVRTVAHEALRLEIPAPKIGIEPGRALIAGAGTSLYRVVSVKRQGARRFAIVDGGLADNPRPALYGSYHHPVATGRDFAAAMVETTVCGRSCENDELMVAPLPEDLRAGDLLGVRTTGAYTFSMASNYNRFAKPAVVFAGGGLAALAVRRQTVDDVLASDV